MKKIIYCIFFLFFSCDENDPKTFDKVSLLGNWKKVETGLNINCIDYLEFNTDTYRTKNVCIGSSTTSGFISYKLDGNDIIIYERVEYKIKYLSQDLLKLENSNKKIEEYVKP